MRCPSCRADNPANATTCMECGDTLPGAILKDPPFLYPVAQAQEDNDEIMDVIPVGSRSNTRVGKHPLPADGDEDDDSGDGGISTLIPYRNPKALAAYYIGIFSLIPVVGLAAAPFAVVLGIMGFRTACVKPEAKGSVHAWIGIVFGLLSLLCNPMLMFFYFYGPIYELRP